MAEPVTLTWTVQVTGDPELDLMQACVVVLRDKSPDTQRRVARYLHERYVERGETD